MRTCFHALSAGHEQIWYFYALCMYAFKRLYEFVWHLISATNPNIGQRCWLNIFRSVVRSAFPTTLMIIPFEVIMTQAVLCFIYQWFSAFRCHWFENTTLVANYRDSCYKFRTMATWFYLYDGDSYADKTAYLYWDGFRCFIAVLVNIHE